MTVNWYILLRWMGLLQWQLHEVEMKKSLSEVVCMLVGGGAHCIAGDSVSVNFHKILKSIFSSAIT